MKHLSRNINVNCNKGAEAEEDKQIKKISKLGFQDFIKLIKWKEKTVGFGLKVH